MELGTLDEYSERMQLLLTERKRVALEQEGK